MGAIDNPQPEIPIVDQNAIQFLRIMPKRKSFREERKFESLIALANKDESQSGKGHPHIKTQSQCSDFMDDVGYPHEAKFTPYQKSINTTHHRVNPWGTLHGTTRTNYNMETTSTPMMAGRAHNNNSDADQVKAQVLTKLNLQ